MTERPTIGPLVAESLLAPLLEAAADTLRALESVDVPLACATCTASTGAG